MAEQEKPTNWLDEVRANADYQARKRVAEQEEAKELAEAKRNGTFKVQTEEPVAETKSEKKGK